VTGNQHMTQPATTYNLASRTQHTTK